MNQSHCWICSYDIRDAKRLKKLHDLLAMSGIAINYSVFYLILHDQQYRAICERIQKIIRSEDDVRLYRCASLQTATTIGFVSPIGIDLIGAQGFLL